MPRASPPCCRCNQPAWCWIFAARPKRPRLIRERVRRATLARFWCFHATEDLYADKALRAGAQGYVMKDQTEETLVAALRTVLRWHAPEPAAAALLAGSAESAGKAADGFAALTARESEILAAMGSGLTTRDIAEKFGLSGRTVEVHRGNIKRKLGCHSLAEMMIKAAEFRRAQDAALQPPAL